MASDKCILVIEDEVNLKFNNLDPVTRRKIVSELKFFVPYARHTPAYKLGRWDGYISLATTGGRTFFNMLDRVLPIVMDAGYEITIDDRRQKIELEFPLATQDMFSDTVWPDGHVNEGESIVLRDYQVEVINTFLKNPQSLQEVATGAGKTLVTAALSKLCEPYGRTIVVVPNRDLVTQTEADYINLGLDVGVFFGGRHEWNKTHTICTWQSLSSLDKKSKNKLVLNDEEIKDFIENVQTIIIDEVHQAKADVLKGLLSNTFKDCPIRWGLTGTIPKEESEFLTILASLGPVVGNLAAKDLQDKGVLSNCHVEILQIQDKQAFSDWHSEKKYLAENEERLDWVSKFIDKISPGGNTLILVNNIATGEMLQETIKNSVFVSGKMKSEERKEEYTAVSTENSKVIIATYGVAAVGINIPRIFNLCLFEPGKSFVRVIQSIGRGLRKAKDKDYVQIYDLTSSCKFSKRHLTARKKFYKQASYPFRITKVNL